MAEAARRTPVALAILVVLAEIAYPLVHGQARATLTIATVLAFFLASVTSALIARGPAWTAGLVLVSAGGGFLAEAVGVASGIPFGQYAYAGSLGAKLAGVPLVIPLAWTMMAYPAYVVAARLVTGRLAQGLLTGLALASWDVFLDPQMVQAGHWRWAHSRPGLPGIPHVPLSNFAGWLAVAVLIGLVLATVVSGRHQPARDGSADAVPVALYLWTYASSVLAHAAFFGLPGSAAWGALLMGLVAVPLAWTLNSRRRIGQRG
ncbi:MAG: carotenoid biosynthesis protein [Actinomycetota bacterium]|nr:carotenoid biosynthesis protein [Actinomycetota bacterium]